MEIVFVFGSNLAGRHGKGAALYARQHYGAEYGVGKGPTGRAYAIPTKNKNLQTLPLDSIYMYIREFLEYAKNHTNTIFLLTPIGTGLAGYSIIQILSLLTINSIPLNVVFTKEWFENEWWDK